VSLRPPKPQTPELTDPLSAALEQEVLAEKVSTLSRLNKKLGAAIARLNSHAAESSGQASDDEYEQLLKEAGEAVWHVMIQRELCGFTKHTAFFDEMGVPKAVRLRAGPLVRPPSP